LEEVRSVRVERVRRETNALGSISPTVDQCAQISFSAQEGFRKRENRGSTQSSSRKGKHRGAGDSIAREVKIREGRGRRRGVAWLVGERGLSPSSPPGVWTARGHKTLTKGSTERLNRLILLRGRAREVSEEKVRKVEGSYRERGRIHFLGRGILKKTEGKDRRRSKKKPVEKKERALQKEKFLFRKETTMKPGKTERGVVLVKEKLSSSPERTRRRIFSPLSPEAARQRGSRKKTKERRRYSLRKRERAYF